MARGWIFNFFFRKSKFTDDLHTRNRMLPKAFCWSHLGCNPTKFLKSWYYVIDDYRLKFFSFAGLPWSPASNSLIHHECSQLTSTSRINVSLWLESASFTENLDESSASVKKRCKKYLGQVATTSCNVSQRVSRKGCMKDKELKFISSSCLWLWNWTIGYFYHVIVFLV